MKVLHGYGNIPSSMDTYEVQSVSPFPFTNPSTASLK